MKNVIIIANIEWGFLKQRHQYVAEGLRDKGYNVVFVESSAKRNPGIKDIPRIISRLYKAILGPKQKKRTSLGVKVVSPIVMPSTNKFFILLNKLFFGRKLVSSINKKLCAGETSILCYIPTSTSFQIIDSIKHERLVYDCVSNFEAVPNIHDSIVEDENYLISKSDLVLTDCDFLYEKHVLKAKGILLVPPGVNSNFFKNEIKVKKIKSACYFGLVSEKTDLDLIYRIHEQGINVTIIGESRVSLDESLIKEKRHSVSHNELPKVLAEFDALILPYVDSEYAKGVIPAKFFECFATGLPIIASNRDNFKKYSNFLITGGSNYEIAKNAKIYEDDEIKRLDRLEIAKANDWDVKFDQFERALNGN